MCKRSEQEEPLSGGNSAASVVRIGDTVRRVMSAPSPAVHRLLDYLEARGFPNSPRFLGIDDRGREILSFQPGHTAWELRSSFPSDNDLARLGQMIRDLHDTLEDFRPPADPNWSSRGADPDGGFHILHNDIGPWNLVVDEEDWVIIDWDEAAPGRVEWELALVVQSFVPLWPDGQLSDAEIARRIVTFGEGYHATSHELRSVVELVPQRCRRFVEMIDDGVRLGDPQLVRMLRQGHREVWAVAAAHASARASTWQGLLG